MHACATVVATQQIEPMECEPNQYATADRVVCLKGLRRRVESARRRRGYIDRTYTQQVVAAAGGHLTSPHIISPPRGQRLYPSSFTLVVVVVGDRE